MQCLRSVENMIKKITRTHLHTYTGTAKNVFRVELNLTKSRYSVRIDSFYIVN